MGAVRMKGNWVGRVLKSLGEGKLEAQTLPGLPKSDEYHLPLMFLWKTVSLGLLVFSRLAVAMATQRLRTSNYICLLLLEPYRDAHMETSFSRSFLLCF